MDYKQRNDKFESTLVIDGVQVLEIDEDSLLENLVALYELVYKHGQIEDHKLSEPDMDEWSKAETLAFAAAGIYDVARRIAELLEPVFSEWLSQHAITEPRLWAESRYNEEKAEESGASISETFTSMVDEYATLTQDVYQWARNAINNKIAEILRESPEKMPAFIELLESIGEDRYQFFHEEWEGEKEDIGARQSVYDTKKEWKENEPTRQDPSDYFFDFDTSDLGGCLEGLNWDVWPIIYEIGANVVFPVWYGRWKAEGIDLTRERIVHAYTMIESIQEDPSDFEINELVTEVDGIINVAHQTGSMMDYIEERYDDVNANILAVLSGVAENKYYREENAKLIAAWDQELEDIGVLPEMDVIAIGRRSMAIKARAEAKRILLDAWQHLADYEQGRNPVSRRKRHNLRRPSLQQAVADAIGR